MFLYNENLKVLKVKSDLIFEKAPQNASKYEMSTKSVRGLGVTRI